MKVTPKWLSDRFFLARRRMPLGRDELVVWGLDLPGVGGVGYETSIEFLDAGGEIMAANLIQYGGRSGGEADVVCLSGMAESVETDAVVALIRALGGEIEE